MDCFLKLLIMVEGWWGTRDTCWVAHLRDEGSKFRLAVASIVPLGPRGCCWCSERLERGVHLAAESCYLALLQEAQWLPTTQEVSQVGQLSTGHQTPGRGTEGPGGFAPRTHLLCLMSLPSLGH